MVRGTMGCCIGCGDRLDCGASTANSFRYSGAVQHARRQEPVPIVTPGAVRVAIEVGLLIVAVVAAFVVWPTCAAGIVVAIGLVMLITGRRRLQWLFGGATS
jgi:hypothetical protein